MNYVTQNHTSSFQKETLIKRAGLTNMFNLSAITSRFSKIPSHSSVEKLHHHAK